MHVQPLDTVRTIQGILAKHGLDVREHDRTKTKDYCYTVTVSLAMFGQSRPDVSTCGKGSHHWFGIVVDEDADVGDLFSLDYLASQLYCRLGNYGRAFYWLRHYLRRIEQSGAREVVDNAYAHCCLACLRLLSMRLDRQQIRKTVCDLFGDEIGRSALDDICRVKGLFDDLELSTCEECEDCSLGGRCRYHAWLGLSQLIGVSMVQAGIDQTRLGSKVAWAYSSERRQSATSNVP